MTCPTAQHILRRPSPAAPSSVANPTVAPTPNTFPILPNSTVPLPGTPPSIPWSLIAAHEVQAARNHGEPLEDLAAAGGLDLRDLVAVLRDETWCSLPDDTAAVHWLLATIADHESVRRRTALAAIVADSCLVAVDFDAGTVTLQPATSEALSALVTTEIDR